MEKFKIEKFHLDEIDRFEVSYVEHNSLIIDIIRIYQSRIKSSIGLIKEQADQLKQYLGEWLYDNKFNFSIVSFYQSSTQLIGTTILLDEKEDEDYDPDNKLLHLSIEYNQIIQDSYRLTFEQVEQLYGYLATGLKQ